MVGEEPEEGNGALSVVRCPAAFPELLFTTDSPTATYHNVKYHLILCKSLTSVYVIYVLAQGYVCVCVCHNATNATMLLQCT